MKKKSFEYYLVQFYIGWMFFVYPLFSKGNYFDITESKWKMLCVATGIFLLLWFCFRVTDGMWVKRNNFQWALDVFAVLVIIASVFSPYASAAWKGSSSRYTGAIFMLLMIVCTMFIASSGAAEQIPLLLRVFSSCGVITAIWAVLNFVGIDPFHMHDRIIETQFRFFMAGIGNVVFLGSFFAVLIPIMFGQFLRADNRRDMTFYGTALLAGCIGLYASGNDSGVIAAFLMLFLAFPAFVEDAKGVIKYLAGMSIVMTAGILIKVVSRYTIYGDVAFDNVLSMILRLYGFEIGLGVCLVFGGIIYFCQKRVSVKWLKAVYYVALAAGVVIIVGTQEQFRSLIVFGDSWGNNRGYVWKKAIVIFEKEPFLRKLFGNGADTFDKLLVKYVGSDIGINGHRFDNVHCEYLQYLLSYGLFGLAAYLYTVGSVIAGLVRSRKRPCCLAVAAGICGYMLQAAIGLNQVFTTPFLFILCGMGIMLVNAEKCKK